MTTPLPPLADTKNPALTTVKIANPAAFSMTLCGITYLSVYNSGAKVLVTPTLSSPLFFESTNDRTTHQSLSP